MVTRAFIPINVGSIVRWEGRRYKITHLLNTAEVLAVNVDTNEKRALSVARIVLDEAEPIEAVPDIGARDLSEITEGEWSQARTRLEIIKTLLDAPRCTRSMVEKVAKSNQLHLDTIYTWLKTYRDSGCLSSLIPRKRGRKSGSRLMSSDQEAIIQESIEKVFLHRQRPKISAVIENVLIACRTSGITAPHANTIRNRIAALPQRQVLRRRGIKEKARNTFEPVEGPFPNAEHPLAVVQIDHTELDIIVVEEQTRKPMGRPWITVAIDVFSRMIVGLYISMERPNSAAVGICVARGMSPKNSYLAELEVPGEWPVWGKMHKIYVDNAKEFRGNMLKVACQQYAIDLEMRPVMRPHYGGHIERYMGTTANEIRKLPGATFSSTVERKGYDSEREAALTLHEVEQHVVDFMVNIYHQRIHASLGTSPSQMWKRGILGDAHRPGIGIQAPPADPLRVQLDFMPLEKRSVQTYGIVIDNINYYHEVLNVWINSVDPDDAKRKREFVIRRDPRDISAVWFYDPDGERYHKIPYRNTTFPAISLWELRSAQQRLKQEGKAAIDEGAIFESIARSRQRVQQAVEKTKAARKQAHRAKAVMKSIKAPQAAPTQRETKGAEIDIFSMPVVPFEDLAVKQ